MVLTNLTERKWLAIASCLVFVGIATFLVGCGQRRPSASDEGGIVNTIPSIGALAGTPEPTFPPIPILSPEKVSLGRRIYEVHCASCHGADLEGEANWRQQNEDGTFRAPPHDASGHTWHHTDEALIESVQFGGQRLPDMIGGTSLMPAFAEILTEDEIGASLDFIKSNWPEDIRAIQWEMTVRSRSSE